MNPSFDLFLNQVIQFFVGMFAAVAGVALLLVFGYMFFQWFKYRNREKYALDFITLLVRLPRDNEIKIDAAEQMFASLSALKHDGWSHLLLLSSLES